ncbi:SAR1A, partial [Symbiodinium sp. CCMP2456]
DMARELRDRTVEEPKNPESAAVPCLQRLARAHALRLKTDGSEENSAPEQSAKQAAVERHTLPPQSTLRQTVSAGNLTMPVAFPSNCGPSKVQMAPGVSPRLGVTPRLQSARTSCVVVPLAQTPRTTSTPKGRAYMYNRMQLKLPTAAPTQAVSSRPTLLVRAASVPAVPKIIRQGTLPTTARCQTSLRTQTPRALRTQAVQVRATQFVPVSRPPVHEQKPREDRG